MNVLVGIGAFVLLVSIVEALFGLKDFRSDRTIAEPWLNLRRMDDSDGLESAKIFRFSVAWKFTVGLLLIGAGIST